MKPRCEPPSNVFGATTHCVKNSPPPPASASRPTSISTPWSTPPPRPSSTPSLPPPAFPPSPRRRPDERNLRTFIRLHARDLGRRKRRGFPPHDGLRRASRRLRHRHQFLQASRPLAL